MEHSERVNFRIMEELERLGIELASPTRTMLVVNEPKRELQHAARNCGSQFL